MPLYAKTTSSAIDIKALQIGTKRQIPVYETTTTTKTGPTCNYANLNEYFTVTQGSSYGWTLSENTSSVKLAPSNFRIHSSTATVTLTAKRNISNLVITGAYYTESRWDKITLTVAGSTKLNAVSGTSALATRVSGVSMTTGQTVVFTYAKDGSGNAPSESSTYFTLTCDPYTETVTEEVITGYVEKLLPTNIIGAWVYKDSTAFQFFGRAGINIIYTGDYTVMEIENEDGSLFEVYELRTSGELTINGSVDVWLCGGGGAGAHSDIDYDSSDLPVICPGGGGGGGYVASGVLAPEKYIVTIGSGGTVDIINGGQNGAQTIIQDKNNAVIFSADYGYAASKYDGGNGGSGGGGAPYYSRQYRYGAAGVGAGMSTYPFGIEILRAHCAGGGGGACYSYDPIARLIGGKGGTDGNNGSEGSYSSSSSSSVSGGAGGEKGGGNGGSTSSGNLINPTAGTFYGAGGGGAACAYSPYSSSPSTSIGGAGYQGVVYLRAKKKSTSGNDKSSVSCTGENTVTTINIDSQTYNLMTIIGSGTLTVEGDGVQVWMCGGGGGGYGVDNEGNTSAYTGGGGGGGYVGKAKLPAGNYAIAIGAGAANTYGTLQTNGASTTISSNGNTILTCAGGSSGFQSNGGNGGSSGGGSDGSMNLSGESAGTSTYPFGIYSLRAHSAGGGGGGYQYVDEWYTPGHINYYCGYSGGSNGTNGEYGGGKNGVMSNSNGGGGGEYGGGAGGGAHYNRSYCNGDSATFYGAGGGGGGKLTDYKGSYTNGTVQGIGGAGYQGVAYVLWPKS